jgi:hypothetical protein
MLKFKPADKCASTMSNDEKQRTPLLLEIKKGTHPQHPADWRVDVDLIFMSVPVTKLTGGMLYASCQGASIRLEVLDQKVIRFTEAASVQFEYTESTTKTRTGSVELKPEIEVSAGPVKAKVGGLGAKGEASKEKTGGYSYRATEDRLAVASDPTFVSWQIDMVRGEHAIRDFLFGNVVLSADCKSMVSPFKGSVKVSPDVYRFDRNKKKMSDTQSLLIHFLLVWEENVLNKAGYSIDFEEKL